MTRRVLPIVLSCFLAGCVSTAGNEPMDPDKQFGHRETDTNDGRVTTVIGPEDGSQTYRYARAQVEEVHVRPGPRSGDPVPVEILVKGAFPDSCTELHEAEQVRSGNIVEVTLTTRRPQGALCAAVIRPYRFYLLLSGQYAAGPYTIKVNEAAFPFEIRSSQS
ncbi:MAG: hypothetical protein JJ896_12060 [Rhodothermales bacterium]|nr:hypothetical protein [Rhodothermales bacterium]MBO6780378.1 hypothetical protein [Rhodothermales bacterium]